MRGLIKSCNIKEELISKVITIIDKIDKLSKEEFITELTNLNLSLNQANQILDIFNYSLEDLNKIYKNNEIEEITIGLQELNQLEEYLSKLNITSYCTFQPSLARGQDYYTGNVFEVYESTGKLNCAIGGGGRYDQMITDFINDGNTYPAVGISFGLTSIFELLKDNQTLTNTSPIDIYIIPMNTEIESLKLANNLRDLNYKVDFDMTSKKMKKSLDYCNKENIPYVIILGEDEIKNNSFKLKDMNNKTEYLIKFTELNKIKEIIKK